MKSKLKCTFQNSETKLHSQNDFTFYEMLSHLNCLCHVLLSFTGIVAQAGHSYKVKSNCKLVHTQCSCSVHKFYFCVQIILLKNYLYIMNMQTLLLFFLDFNILLCMLVIYIFIILKSNQKCTKVIK
jgi:hypothetical protein